MSEGVETKTCDFCAEPIRVAANICPYCRRWQRPWRLKRQVQAWLMLAFPALMMLAFFIWIHFLFGPGHDFEEFRNKITIVDAEMHFSHTTNGNYISTIGHVRNDSIYGWKNLQLEVQYFNKDGRMIDTRTEERYSESIPAGTTQAFRIRGPADKPESEYATEKVFVRSASDLRKWL